MHNYSLLLQYSSELELPREEQGHFYQGHLYRMFCRSVLASARSRLHCPSLNQLGIEEMR